MSKGVKSRRTTGVRMKVLCTTSIEKKQRGASIALENIELASEIVLSLARDARPVEFSNISRLRLRQTQTQTERESNNEYCLTLESTDG